MAEYQAKYPKAAKCLVKDREVLLACYDIPAEHWRHLRTTNSIESTFATIRLRHCRTKGNGSCIASLTMMFKLAESVAKRWRLPNGHELLPDVICGGVFQDGLRLDPSRRLIQQPPSTTIDNISSGDRDAGRIAGVLQSAPAEE